MAASIVMDQKTRDAQAQAAIMERLIQSGEHQRLKELLKARLIESGWRDDIKNFCKETIKSKGLEKITVDELVAEVTPQGRATVPAKVKSELLEEIQKFMAAAPPSKT